jgi:periplasmic copper chaperone A
MKPWFARSSFTSTCLLQTIRWSPLALLLAAGAADAGDIAIADAWTPPSAEVGSNAVVGMVVTNEGADADALVRVSCPISNFSEKRQIDLGEGAPSAREIREIPIAAKSKTVLNRDGYHLVLLQTREALKEGDEFQCSISFKKAGKLEVQVHVTPKAPGS